MKIPMPRTRWSAWLMVTAMVLAACGTRLGDDAFDPGIVGATAAADGGGATGEWDAGGVGDGTDFSDLPGSSGGDRGSDGAPGSTAGASPGFGGVTNAGDSSSGSGTSDAGPSGTASSEAGTSGGGDPSADSDAGSGSANDTAANEPSDTGVFVDRIKVGNMVDKGGALGPDAFTPMYYGANAYFLYLNATQGGIHGREVEFITCDTKESQDESFRCAERLIEGEKVFALVANNLRSYASAEYVSDNGVPDVGGQPIGNEYYTHPTLFSMIDHGYARDGRVGDDGTLYWGTGGFHWFAARTEITKAAVFYYSIPISKQIGMVIVEALNEAGVETIEFEINPALPNFDASVVTMQNEGVDAIYDVMDNNANRNLCDSMQRRNFSVKVKSTTVAGWTRAVKDTYSDVCRPSLHVVGFTRPTSDTSHPEIKLFNEVMSRVYNGRFDETMHQWHLEGWIAAKMFAQEVEAMGPTPTRQGLIDRLNAFDRNTLDGLHKGLDWRVKDYANGNPPQCAGLSKWNEDIGDFVAIDDTFRCFSEGGWLAFEPSA